MAANSVLDFDTLLTPIPGENPSGVEVRYTRYDEIKEARRQDDNLPKGDWEEKGPAKTADWKKVMTIASKALSTETKDLQLAVWLLEALVKEEGFIGLRDGLILLKELHARFWDSVYPIIEDGDFSFRAGPIDWMNEEKNLPFGIRGIPFIRSPEGEGYALLHWEEAQEVENLGRKDPKEKAAAIEENKLTVEQFNKAVQSTPLPHCLALLEQVQQCQEAIDGLQQVILEKYGESNDERPSIEKIRKVLEEAHTILEGIVRGKGGAKVEIPGAAGETGGAAATGRREQTRSTGGGIHPADRIDALQRLAAVVEFFRETEPHSPVAPLVQRAAQWGEMPLKEWLEEVIDDRAVLGKVLETLGMKEKPSQE
jgi:type VI secretion system protein ImpA